MKQLQLSFIEKITCKVILWSGTTKKIFLYIKKNNGNFFFALCHFNLQNHFKEILLSDNRKKNFSNMYSTKMTLVLYTIQCTKIATYQII